MGFLTNSKEYENKLIGIRIEDLDKYTDIGLIMLTLARVLDGNGIGGSLIDELYRRGRTSLTNHSSGCQATKQPDTT